jgi:hypothetical protein
MRNRSCIDSIVDDYKSAVYLPIYRGGGLDPLQTNFRAYPMILANNHSTKLETLICSAHARTVRPTCADRPDRGPSGLRAGPSALNLVLNKNITQCLKPLLLLFEALLFLKLGEPWVSATNCLEFLGASSIPRRCCRDPSRAASKNKALVLCEDGRP